MYNNYPLPGKFSDFRARFAKFLFSAHFSLGQQKPSKKLATAIGAGGTGRNVRHKEVNLIVRLYTVVISHDLCTNE